MQTRICGGLPNRWISIYFTLATLSAAGNGLSINICTNKDLFLSASNSERGEHGTITSDPFPLGVVVTCRSSVTFSEPVALSIALTDVSRWRQSPVGSPGWAVMSEEGKKSVSWQTTGETWMNTTSDSCQYLNVLNIISAASNRSVNLIANRNVTLNATKVEFTLDRIPSTEWCAIQIEISVLPLPTNFCRAEGLFYCESSMLCLEAARRCDRVRDCNGFEDENNCETFNSYTANTGTRAEQGLLWAVTFRLASLNLAMAVVTSYIL